MNNSKYQLQIGAKVFYTKIILEVTKGIGQRNMRGDTKDFFLFDSRFYLNNLVEDAMDVGTKNDWYV